MQRINRKRALPLIAASGVLTYAAATRETVVVIPIEDARITAAGTWDDGRSMDEVAQEEYLAQAAWWDFAHWLLMNNPNRTRAITFGDTKR